MEKVALDTSVCIAIFKNAAFAQSFTRHFSGQRPYLPSIVAFELLLREHSLNTVELFLQQSELLEFNENAAKKAAEITKELRSKGQAIGTNDVLIAATAIVNNCELATLDVNDFSKIKGLKIAAL